MSLGHPNFFESVGPALLRDYILLSSARQEK